MHNVWAIWCWSFQRGGYFLAIKLQQQQHQQSMHCLSQCPTVSAPITPFVGKDPPSAPPGGMLTVHLPGILAGGRHCRHPTTNTHWYKTRPSLLQTISLWVGKAWWIMDRCDCGLVCKAWRMVDRSDCGLVGKVWQMIDKCDCGLVGKAWWIMDRCDCGWVGGAWQMMDRCDCGWVGGA